MYIFRFDQNLNKKNKQQQKKHLLLAGHNVNKQYILFASL